MTPLANVRLLLLCCLLPPIACTEKPEHDPWVVRRDLPLPQDDATLVRFADGSRIGAAEFEHFWRSHPALGKTQAMEALVEEHMIVLDAKAHPTPPAPARLQAALMQGFAGAWLNDFEQSQQPIDTTTQAFRDALRAEMERARKPESIVADTLWVNTNEPKGCDEAVAQRAATALMERHLRGKPHVTRADLLGIEEATETSFMGCDIYAPQPWHYTTAHHPVEALPQGWSLLLPDLVPVFKAALTPKEGGSNLVGPLATKQGQMIFAPQRLEPGEPADEARVRARLLERLRLRIRQAAAPRALSSLLEATSLTTFPQNLDDRSPLSK